MGIKFKRREEGVFDGDQNQQEFGSGHQRWREKQGSRAKKRTSHAHNLKLDRGWDLPAGEEDPREKLAKKRKGVSEAWRRASSVLQKKEGQKQTERIHS